VHPSSPVELPICVPYVQEKYRVVQKILLFLTASLGRRKAFSKDFLFHWKEEDLT